MKVQGPLVTPNVTLAADGTITSPGFSVTPSGAVTGVTSLPAVSQTTDQVVTGTANSSPFSVLGTSAVQRIILNASVAFNWFVNPSAGQSVTLILIQGSAGGPFTVDWTGLSVVWPGGTPPTLTVTANKTDIISIYFDGFTYFGFVAGQGY